KGHSPGNTHQRVIARPRFGMSRGPNSATVRTPMPGMTAIATDSNVRFARHVPRIPPSIFSMAFGLAGLGGAWLAARPLLSISPAVPDAIFILAAVVWILLVAGYLAQGRAQLVADWRDGALSPFIPLAVIVPMILAVALSKYAFWAGRILVIVFLALTVA